MYSPQVSDHISNPRNVGELERPTGIGDVTNDVCLDRIRLSIDVRGDMLVDAKVLAQGCPPTIAAASALTELIIGKSVAELESLDRKDLASMLGRLPPAKTHCLVLALDALRDALRASCASR
ncbi:MAG TPA: iron-sulfur cluster assembly scaffold protein [Blastocatellia bacterium]|nr:iron-sulfur cluster assembly scaffold protein [Blastocatellia bacterium]